MRTTRPVSASASWVGVDVEAGAGRASSASVGAALACSVFFGSFSSSRMAKAPCVLVWDRGSIAGMPTSAQSPDAVLPVFDVEGVKGAS